MIIIINDYSYDNYFNIIYKFNLPACPHGLSMKLIFLLPQIRHVICSVN